MKIGIFDSGMGGLSVLHRAKKMLPNAHFIYYADEKHVPYGEKSIPEIRGYVEEVIEFLMEKNVDAILIACNTATTVADQKFREKYPIPIIGMEPAVKKAVEEISGPDKRILVAATPVTIAGKKLRDLIARVDHLKQVDLVALPKLVRFAEKGDFDSEEVRTYLLEELSAYDLEKYESLVLGCTHFNYFKKTFCKVFPNEICFVDGNEGTIRQMIRRLPQQVDQEDQPGVEVYLSGEAITEADKQKILQNLKQLEIVFEI